MLPIYFSNCKESGEQFKIIKKILNSSNESYSCFENQCFKCVQNKLDHDILLLSGGLKSIDAEKIIIISEEIKETNKLSIKAETQAYYLFDNDMSNRRFNKVKENEFYLPCGFGAKDIFSYSSYENESAVVSLQETIKTLTGEHIEPSEVPIIYESKPNKFSLLSSVAILYLLNHQFTNDAIKI